MLVRVILSESAQFELPPGGFVTIDGDSGRGFMEITASGPGGNRRARLGSIRLGRTSVEEGSVWEVENSEASSGWGPLLYDLAMELAGPDYMGDLGIAPDRMNVSPSARGVWRHYFESRPDVEHEPLPDWYSDVERSEPLRYYYFKLDAPVLSRLIAADSVRSSSDGYPFSEFLRDKGSGA
jgi:hypothetical protein